MKKKMFNKRKIKAMMDDIRLYSKIGLKKVGIKMKYPKYYYVVGMTEYHFIVHEEDIKEDIYIDKEELLKSKVWKLTDVYPENSQDKKERISNKMINRIKKGKSIVFSLCMSGWKYHEGNPYQGVILEVYDNSMLVEYVEMYKLMDMLYENAKGIENVNLNDLKTTIMAKQTLCTVREIITFDSIRNGKYNINDIFDNGEQK